MDDSPLEDVRARDPVERLLEDSWEARSRAASRRELIVEAGAAALFLAVAVPLAVPAVAGGQLRPGLALFLVGLYAVVSRAVKFPIGAGYVVPSYLVLVPMLLMLPPTTVPAAGSRWSRARHSGTVDRAPCNGAAGSVRDPGCMAYARSRVRARARRAGRTVLVRSCTSPRLLPGAHLDLVSSSAARVTRGRYRTAPPGSGDSPGVACGCLPGAARIARRTRGQ